MRAAPLTTMEFRELLIGLIIILLAAHAAHAGEQVRLYGPDGKSIGTAVPYGTNSTRFYDARGKSMGTSTTVGGATTFYDAQGRVIGRSSR